MKGDALDLDVFSFGVNILTAFSRLHSPVFQIFTAMRWAANSIEKLYTSGFRHDVQTQNFIFSINVLILEYKREIMKLRKMSQN